MTDKQFQVWYFKVHRLYENRALSILNKYVRGQLKKMDLTEQNYAKELKKGLPNSGWFNAMQKVYFEIGLLHNKNVAKGLKNGSAMVKNDFPITTLFSKQWAELIKAFFNATYKGSQKDRIVTVNKNLIDTLTSIIRQELGRGNSIENVATRLQNDFGKSEKLYKWQMLRIARTESGAAASMAAIETYKNERIIIDKVWISALDDRTRDGKEPNEYNHIKMHNKVKPIGEYFEVPNENGGSDFVLYPSDVGGAAGNVINCRCSVAPKVRLDADGLPMRRDPNEDLTPKPRPEPTAPKTTEAEYQKILGIEPTWSEDNLSRHNPLGNNTFMTVSEKYAINQWSGEFFEEINAYELGRTYQLRYKVGELWHYYDDDPAKGKAYFEALKSQLDSALQKIRENETDGYYSGTVYRGDKLRQDGKYTEYLEGLQVGAVIEYPVNMSTSTDSFTASSFARQRANHTSIIYTIQTKTGGTFLNEFSANATEEEVLFMAGQQFKILEIGTDVDGRTLTVTMETI